jgi:hypothetical protein
MINRVHGTTVKSIDIWYATSAIDVDVQRFSFGIHTYVLVSYQGYRCFSMHKTVPPFIVAINFASQWNTTGITVAGITGSSGVAANQLYMPISIAVDTSKTLYISENGNHRIQKFLPGASNGTTVAGVSTVAQAVDCLN